MEALLRMERFTERAKKMKQMVVTVSLEIKNAFNFLFWNPIIRQLKQWNIPDPHHTELFVGTLCFIQGLRRCMVSSRSYSRGPSRISSVVVVVDHHI